MKPTIYLTNATSRKPPHRGPNRVWTIMARPNPRHGEAGDGRCIPLIPVWQWVSEAKAGRLPMEEYQQQYMALILVEDLRPGQLAVDEKLPSGAIQTALVADGDTLICACSRAKAAAGLCHRVWASRALRASGWRVVLDGEAQ